MKQTKESRIQILLRNLLTLAERAPLVASSAEMMLTKTTTLMNVADQRAPFVADLLRKRFHLEVCEHNGSDILKDEPRVRAVQPVRRAAHLERALFAMADHR